MEEEGMIANDFGFFNDFDYTYICEDWASTNFVWSISSSMIQIKFTHLEHKLIVYN